MIVCTNALLLEKKLHLFKPNKYFTFSVHLDGDKGDHDRSVCQDGVYDKAVEAIRKVKAAGLPHRDQRHACSTMPSRNASPASSTT